MKHKNKSLAPVPQATGASISHAILALFVRIRLFSALQLKQTGVKDRYGHPHVAKRHVSVLKMRLLEHGNMCELFPVFAAN